MVAGWCLSGGSSPQVFFFDGISDPSRPQRGFWRTMWLWDPLGISFFR
jgi:hypothetical protein